MKIPSANFIHGNNRNWAIDNKYKGFKSTLLTLGGTAACCIKAFVEEKSVSNKVLTFFQGLFDGLRNKEQYEIYSRADDDLGEDRVKRKFAGKIGETACFIEKKINPILAPIASLCGEKINDSYNLISHWFNSLWWRFRLCSEKVSWQDLKLFHIKLRQLFNKDVTIRRKSLLEIKNLISPLLGQIGLLTTGIFTPLKALNKLKGFENKWIDCLASIGFMTQHLAYAFRFTFLELFKAQNKESKYSYQLAYLGAAANIANIAMPMIDLLPLNNKAKTIYKELAQGLTRLFFSVRRNSQGNKWLEKNNDVTGIKLLEEVENKDFSGTARSVTTKHY